MWDPAGSSRVEKLLYVPYLLFVEKALVSYAFPEFQRADSVFTN